MNISDGALLHGEAVVFSMSVQTSAKGTTYATGKLLIDGELVEFKSWNNSAAYMVLTSTDCVNHKIQFSGKGNEYNNSLSIILETFTLGVVLTGEELLPLLPQTYNDMLEGQFFTLLSENLSEKAYAIMRSILGTDGIWEKFKWQFAARTHHDNCPRGLLAHTYKVTALMIASLSYYSTLREYGKDLLIMGTALHDIGKIFEMSNGEYVSPYERVTHRVLGLEVLFKHKQEIVDAFDEEFYYDLLAIVNQHHDKYGEPCRTAWAEMVATVDSLDAMFTQFNADFASGKDATAHADALLKF